MINPGIRLPRNNALQLLRSDHPVEWFDENENSLFNFSANRFYKLNAFAIWGTKPTRDAHSFIVDKTGTLEPDKHFKLTRQTIKKMIKQLEILRNSQIIQ
uniref:Uncharacterized protein n=1 Tax=Panagrolaimus sp. JU765 TaxID=591449 RepID=A0AC34RFU4_9BILA